jgi:hypothetical protein
MSQILLNKHVKLSALQTKIVIIPSKQFLPMTKGLRITF